MKVYIVNCTFNISQNVLDCAFREYADAESYVDGLNGNKEKAVARCKELIALRDSKAMVQFLDGESKISFEVLPAELK